MLLGLFIDHPTKLVEPLESGVEPAGRAGGLARSVDGVPEEYRHRNVQSDRWVTHRHLAESEFKECSDIEGDGGGTTSQARPGDSTGH